jgi:hypothetical protein
MVNSASCSGTGVVAQCPCEALAGKHDDIIDVLPHCRIGERPGAFKLVELAQVCWACKEIKFRNAKLMDAIAAGIAAAPRADVNPASITNLLSYISSLEYMNPTTMDQLVRLFAKLLAQSKHLQSHLRSPSNTVWNILSVLPGCCVC